MSRKILVSSCLIGKKCAYDGAARSSDAVRKLCRHFECVDICPEMDGALGSPREKHEIVGGVGEDVLDGDARVRTAQKEDHTADFIRGAETALKKAIQESIKVAIFKSRSPSCGRGKIHAGRFDGSIRNGNGVTTALLLRNGIKVFTEEHLDEAKSFLTG